MLFFTAALRRATFSLSDKKNLILKLVRIAIVLIAHLKSRLLSKLEPVLQKCLMKLGFQYLITVQKRNVPSGKQKHIKTMYLKLAEVSFYDCVGLQLTMLAQQDRTENDHQSKQNRQIHSFIAC